MYECFLDFNIVVQSMLSDMAGKVAIKFSHKTLIKVT